MKVHAKIVVIMVAAGCDQLEPATHRALSALGMGSAASEPTPQLVFCSLRANSTCTPYALSEVVRGKLAKSAVVAGPVEVWAPDGSSPAVLVAASTPWKEPIRGGDRTRAKALAQWIDDEADRLTATVEPLRKKVTGTAQPLAEAVALMGKRNSGPRTITLVSSGAEVSRYADFECAIAKPDKFLAAMQRGPWPAAALAGLHIEFAFVTGQAPHRKGCVATAKKARVQARAWTQAATAAGATVEFLIGARSSASPVKAPYAPREMP